MDLKMFSIKYFKYKSIIWESNNINYHINRPKEKTQMIISEGTKKRQVNETQNPLFYKISQNTTTGYFVLENHSPRPNGDTFASLH